MSNSSATAATTGAPATRAASFVDSIGVNAHLGWWNTAWGAGNGQWAGAETKVASELAYLGVSLVRDSVPYSSAVAAEYGLLAQAGIRFDMIQTTGGGPVQLASDIAEMASFEASYPGAIFAYEGANEYNANSYTLDGHTSLNNPAWGVLDAQVSSAALAANAQLAAAGVMFIAPSTALVSSAPDMSPYVAASNWHVYAGPGQQLQNNIYAGVAAAEASAPGVPVILTEVGVSSAAISSSTWGVAGTDALQGLIDLNAVLDAYKAGAQETFLYELMDDNAATDQEDNFGLFNADGSPKAAAVYIHDLISILQDNGASATTFTPGSLNYAVTNLPTTASSMLLEKSSGAYDITIWNGKATVFNATTDAAVTPATSNVTVQLGGTYQTVQIFDPVLGATAIQTLYNVSAVTLALTADPLIVEVEPNSTSSMYSPGAAGGTINSIGDDTVLIGSGAVTVNASGPSVYITGGAGALTYSGTAVATIVGGEGAMNITLDGSGSSVTGGSGGMTVLDTVGGNTITGAPGSANNGITVTTTKGNDVITTGDWTATNRINLGAGDDSVISNGTSTIVGSTGNDHITVNGWWGTITTSTGANQVTMNAPGMVTTHGTDTVRTTVGLTLAADGPSTTLTAGAGFVWLSGTGWMNVTGGIGGGYFDMTQSQGGSIQTAAGATDTILLGTAVMTVTTSGHDTVRMGSDSATISALAGSLAVAGGAGALTYSGTAVATIVGGAGAMNITLAGSGSSVTGGSGGMTVLDTVGGNTITGAPGSANTGITVTTTKGNDVITTGDWTATNQINLGAGNDTVISNGTSTIVGSTGNDQITVNGWWGIITTSTGTNQVTMNAPGVVTTHGTDTVRTTAGLTLAADGPSTTLTAGAGFVWLSGTGAMNVTGGIGGGYFDMTQSQGGSIQTAAGATDTILLGAAATSVTASGHDTMRMGSGPATISALAGSIAVAGGSGKMTFIEGASTSSVAIGAGASTFDFINGSAGGSLTIEGFRLGTDTLHLQGYTGSGVSSEQVVGGALQIVLTDHTRVTLAGFTQITNSIFS